VAHIDCEPHNLNTSGDSLESPGLIVIKYTSSIFKKFCFCGQKNKIIVETALPALSQIISLLSKNLNFNLSFIIKV